jgi:peptide/nickel transport system substrate-binding protein
MAARRRARRARSGTALVAAVAVALLGGCSSDEGESAVGEIAQPGSGGTLTWALSQRPGQLDPLLATSWTDLLLARQIYEPLTATATVPFAEERTVDGLASARASANDTVWRLKLRRGISFQDGTAFDARAVRANARRWQTTPAGQELLPNLTAVDNPRPDLVRFFLDRPNPEFDLALAAPNLGIVSPQALRPRSGAEAEVRDQGHGGTGPFELRERSRMASLIARNVEWWGSTRDLGPVLDQVAFRVVPNPEDRYRLLRAGDVQVADGLGADQVARLRRDPLLTSLPVGDGTALGLERSVRGIDSGRGIPSLSGVWLSRIGAE